MIKKYFTYLWNKTNKLILVGLIVCVLLFPAALLMSGETWFTYFQYPLFDGNGSFVEWVDTGYAYYPASQTKLYLYTILTMAGSYLVPIIVQATFQNKKRCDNLFSLPIRKETQILLTSVYGFVALQAVLWASALLGLGASAIVGLRYNIGYYFLYLLVMFALSLGVYGITTLYASLMNGCFDSVLLVLLSMLFPVVFCAAFCKPSFGSPYLFTSPLYAANKYTCFFQEQVTWYADGLKELFLTLSPEQKLNTGLFRYDFGGKELGALFAFLGYGALSYGASFLLWKRVKAEDAQTPSKRWYSYPLVFSAVMFCIFYMGNLWNNHEGDSILANLVLIVAYFVFMFIMQRKIKFTKTIVIAFSLTFVLANIFGILLY